MKPHFRSSEFDRILTCNGSITLASLVAPRDGDEGREGTWIHHAIADRLVRLHGAIPADGDLPPPDVPAGYKLPPFSAWIIDWGVRHVLETIPSHWCIFVELPLRNEHGRWIQTGHIDVTGINPEGTEAIGIDWKTGRDPVDPAENNEQVASYMTLLKSEWPTLESITFQIAQPRVDEEAGFERVSTVVVTGDALTALVASIDRRICAAMDNAMELNSGIKQCRWCPVAGPQCKAHQILKALMKATLTEEDVARVAREPDDAQLADWIIAMRTLAAPTKDATELLHKRLDTKPEIEAGDGTRITRKIQKGSYSVPDPVKFMAAVRTLLPKDEMIAKTFTPSMTRIQDEIAAVNNVPKTGKSGVSAQSIFDGHLRPLVEQGDKRVLQFSV
jgi:hypothetical protein